MHFNLQGIPTFLKGVLSESTGEPSFGRLGAAGVILSTLFWISYVVIKTHAIPELSGPSLFLTTGTGATYGANKVAGAFKHFDSNFDSQTDSHGVMKADPTVVLTAPPKVEEIGKAQ